MVCPNDVSLESEYYATLACSLLSALGSLFIILSYILLTKSRNYCFRIVLIISLTDCIRAIIFCIPISLIKSSWLCLLTSSVLYCTIIVSIVWTTAIALTLYQLVIHSQQDFTVYTRFWIALSIIGSLAVFGPICMGDVGEIGTICTFSQSLGGDLWRLFLLYIPVWFNIILSLVCYVKIYLHICDIGIEESRKAMLRKFALYPVVSVLVFTPLTAIRVLEAFGGSCEDSVTYVVVMSIFCLHGFLDSVIYIWAVDFREAFKLEFSATLPEKSINVVTSYTSSNLLFNSTTSSKLSNSIS